LINDENYLIKMIAEPKSVLNSNKSKS